MTTASLTFATPNPPTNVATSGGVNSAVITWTGTSDSTDKYQVWESTANDSSTASLIATVAANFYTVQGLTPGTYKYYWVKTITTNGVTSSFSSYTGPSTTLGGTNFNTLKLAFRGEWRGVDDYSYAYRGFQVDQIQLNINYTNAGSFSTGWVTLTTTVTQADGSGAFWSNPNYVNVADSQDAGAAVQSPGATRSLICALSDAGVPAGATVTGIQARVTGYVGDGRTPGTPVAEFKNIFQIVSMTGTAINVRYGLTKEITYTAKNTPQTLTVGGTTDTWGLAVAGTGAPATATVAVNNAGTTSASGLTFSNGGLGDASGTTYDGGTARNISYNSIGAAPLASPTFTGVPAAPTATTGTNTTQLSTTAFCNATAAAYASYSRFITVFHAAASHTAGQVAGTYWLGNGNPAGVTDTGTLYPPMIMYVDPADYPTVNGLSAKFRLRVALACNDVASGGNLTFGLYPVTRPATSGGAGLDIYTMGTVVTGSTVLTTPTADMLSNFVTSEFTIGVGTYYVIGFVSTATVATSSHIHINAQLQMHNA